MYFHQDSVEEDEFLTVYVDKTKLKIFKLRKSHFHDYHTCGVPYLNNEIITWDYVKQLYQVQRNLFNHVMEDSLKKCCKNVVVEHRLNIDSLSEELQTYCKLKAQYPYHNNFFVPSTFLFFINSKVSWEK